MRRHFHKTGMPMPWVAGGTWLGVSSKAIIGSKCVIWNRSDCCASVSVTIGFFVSDTPFQSQRPTPRHAT